jgi:flavodoxin
MKVVIVFESMFGNTRALADAVADGLSGVGADVALVEVGLVAPQELAGCQLLVLAAPTHALTMSRPESRADAVHRGADPSHARGGVREWLDTVDEVLPPTAPRPMVAVFDSRVSKARHWPGSAAGAMARAMRRHGFTVVDRASFYVQDVTGPVVAGERDRAREWGSTLTGLATSKANGEQIAR